MKIFNFFKPKTVLILCFAFIISACATIEGVGKDIETAGEAIQDAADGE